MFFKTDPLYDFLFSKILKYKAALVFAQKAKAYLQATTQASVQAPPCRPGCARCCKRLHATISMPLQASASVQAFLQEPQCKPDCSPHCKPSCRYLRAGFGARMLVQAPPCRHLRVSFCRQARPRKPSRRPFVAGLLAGLTAGLPYEHAACHMNMPRCTRARLTGIGHVACYKY